MFAQEGRDIQNVAAGAGRVAVIALAGAVQQLFDNLFVRIFFNLNKFLKRVFESVLLRKNMTNGKINIVNTLSLCDSRVLVASIPGILHPKPSSIGIKDFP